MPAMLNTSADSHIIERKDTKRIRKARAVPVDWHPINSQVPRDLWREVRDIAFSRKKEVREVLTAALRRYCEEARRVR